MTVYKRYAVKYPLLCILTEDCSIVDEKKIISDLPVNCKLCGVTIRQSRNLRRHIDHMHLKQKLRSKSKDTKDKESESESVLNTFKAAFTKKIDDFNNNPGTSAVLNFSEDSFTQLTEEIFNCTAVSTLSSGESSLSSSNIQMTSSTCTYAAEVIMLLRESISFFIVKCIWSLIIIRNR